MSKIFSFHDQPIRIVSIDNQPWFIGRDIALLLGYTKTDKDIRRICKHVKLFKGTKSVPLKNAPRGLLIIPEPDVWRLIIRSRLPKAQEIEEWVMSDVLPSLRTTGEYKVKQKIAPKKKALPRAQVALPSKSYEEECREAVAELVSLRGELFRVTSRVSDILSLPFGRATQNNELKPFARPMNFAIQAFVVAVYKNLETVELLFKSYVEAEKLIRK